MVAEPTPEKRKPDSAAGAISEVVIDSRTLFKGNREIVVEHDGERYRLRITRRNKLILQK